MRVRRRPRALLGERRRQLRVPIGQLQPQRDVRALGRLQHGRRLLGGPVVQRVCARVHSAAPERNARSDGRAAYEPHAERHMHAASGSARLHERRVRSGGQRVRLRQRRRPMHVEQREQGLPFQRMQRERDLRAQRRVQHQRRLYEPRDSRLQHDDATLGPDSAVQGFVEGGGVSCAVGRAPGAPTPVPMGLLVGLGVALRAMRRRRSVHSI